MTDSSISLRSTSGVPSDGVTRENSKHLDSAIYCIEGICTSMGYKWGSLDPQKASRSIKEAVQKFKSDLEKDKPSYIDDFDRHALEIEHLKTQKQEYQELANTIDNVKKQYSQLKIDEVRKEIDSELASLDKSIGSSALEAFERFYSATLDSRPDLDPHLKGGHLDEELHYTSADLKAFLQEHGDDLDPKYKKTLMEFIDQLQRSSIWARVSGRDRTFREILEKIQKLEFGESCLIPGGSDGHAFIYKVVRLTKDEISFTIINTGADESIFKMISRVDILESDFTHLKGIHYFDKSYILYIAALDRSFLEAISRKENEDTPAEEVIAKVDQLLVDRKATHIKGRSHAPQLRGSCFVKCITSWLKDELIRIHGPRGKVVHEQFRAYRTQKNIHAISRVQQAVSKDVLHEVYREPNPKKLETRLNTMHVEARRVSRKRARKAVQLKQEQIQPPKFDAEMTNLDSTSHLEMGFY